MSRGLLLPLATLVVLAAVPAQAQKRDRVTPYIEAGQVMTADISNGGDILTYSTVSAGIDASIHRRRVEVEVSYRYEHMFPVKGNLQDSDFHSGLARMAVRVASGLSFEAGGIATRARSDARGDYAVSLAGNPANVAQVFSGYAGPTFAAHAGPINLNAAYRFGYTYAEDPSASGVSPLAPTLDRYGSSKLHVATASAGVAAGRLLPVGITGSVGWEHENAGHLDQAYDGKFARGDLVLPIGAGLALAGGAGYERIRSTQRDPLLDAGGRPVLDSHGRYVTNPASPQRVAFETDGLIWDAGVVYRPNRRITLEARAGRRYGSMSYTGSLQAALGRTAALQVGVYDGVTSYGRQLNGSIAMLPTSFTATSDPFGDSFNNCVFGSAGGAAGNCFSGVFQSMPTATYRARGVNAVYTMHLGRTTFGFGGGYANRRYFAPQVPGLVSLNGVTDVSYFGQLFLNRELTRNSGVAINAFGNYFDPGLAGTDPVYGGGANLSYHHNWGALGLNLSAGMFTSGQQNGGNSDVSAQASAAVRYQF